ncbi:M20/M25/M40 family metallo-hydrolase [Microlunatus ginsengisoli]|uniref:Dipeptidase n=1 Tax=Microlunatus ginsengisoli TaxID=363863 RepID=A0ABP7A7B8_9ACTN
MSELTDRVDALMPRLVEDLKRLVAIPSIAFEGFDRAPVLAAHDLIVELLRDAGVADVGRLELPDTAPIITATVPGPPGAPTVLLYAHYDVQPAGDEALWQTPPFTPTEIDGVVHGRGAADDKSNVIAHIGALRAMDGRPPVTLKIVFEGQEEWGSPFDGYPVTDPGFFACDAMVIADMGNIEPGRPTFTTALRGDTEVTVSLRTLPEPKHSGEFGGPAPDALIALIHALATLHDDRGNVAVAGLRDDTWTGAAPIDDDEFRRMAGIAPGTPLFGDGTIADRLWSGPAITVVGMDVPKVDGAVLAVNPYARAMINIRVHPLQSAAEAQDAVVAHLESIKPFGLELTVERSDAGNGFEATTTGPAYVAAREALRRAWGAEPIEVGSGGAIPLVSGLHDAVPTAEILLFGAEDMQCNLHAPNERVVIDEIRRTVIAMVEFFHRYAAGQQS